MNETLETDRVLQYSSKYSSQQCSYLFTRSTTWCWYHQGRYADPFCPSPRFDGSPLTPRAEEFDRAAAASIFAQNPKLVQMIQGKLGSLVGRSSGYVESLPAPVRRRVAGLKGVQKNHSKLEAEFQEEVLELEKKYFAKFTPLYEKRAKIVNGAVEPTEDEIKAGEEDDEEEDAAGTCKIVPRFSIPCIERDLWAVIQSLASICSPICVELADVLSEPIEKGPETSDVKGIPEFWLSAMKNQGK
jgi:nucleosome assembly protein 1-like 1